MKHIEVVAAVIVRDGRYFATQRGYGEYKDKWEFPGGKVEPGESREEALIREIREELATTIGIERFICTVDYDYPDFHLTMHCYLCHVVSGHLQLLEAEDARWLNNSHLLTVDWLPADKEVVTNMMQTGL
jgi:8-oxo-dGTP diphosphatase